MLGVQITDSGARMCASPVGRVMAYASAKYDALQNILTAEMQALGPDIRAVIVTDFEKTSATALVEGVLDKEAGGAVAAYRAVLQSESTDRLDPVLMTGTTVLVDDDLLIGYFLDLSSGFPKGILISSSIMLNEEIILKLEVRARIGYLGITP